MPFSLRHLHVFVVYWRQELLEVDEGIERNKKCVGRWNWGFVLLGIQYPRILMSALPTMSKPS